MTSFLRCFSKNPLAQQPSRLAHFTLAALTALTGCGTVVTGGGGGVDDSTSTTTANTAGTAAAGVEVIAGWEDLTGVPCDDIDPQLYPVIQPISLDVSCAPGAMDTISATSFDIEYQAFCTTGPAYVVIESASLTQLGSEPDVFFDVSPKVGPNVAPGGKATTTVSIPATKAPGICGFCDASPSFVVAWNKKSGVDGILVQPKLDCSN